MKRVEAANKRIKVSTLLVYCHLDPLVCGLDAFHHVFLEFISGVSDCTGRSVEVRQRFTGIEVQSKIQLLTN